MKFTPNNFYHVYNQGNNKQIIFSSDEDYLVFLKKIRLLILPHANIVAYCLMPNHFHFLIFTDERVGKGIKLGSLIIDPLTEAIRKLLSNYARVYNKKYNRTGSLFRQKTKSKCLSEIVIHENNSITL